MATHVRGRRVEQAKHVYASLIARPGEIRNLPRLARCVGSSTLELRLPWLPFPVIDLLSASLSTSSRVFEYGGGGSTAFFADRGAHVMTVEHDSAWFEVLTDQLKALPTVSVVLRGQGRDYSDYISEIDRFEDDSFDVVVVDGRERVACFTTAISKVAPGGLLILDDVDRPRYQPAFAATSWPRTVYRAFAPGKPMLGHTAVFRRPS